MVRLVISSECDWLSTTGLKQSFEQGLLSPVCSWDASPRTSNILEKEAQSCLGLLARVGSVSLSSVSIDCLMGI